MTDPPERVLVPCEHGAWVIHGGPSGPPFCPGGTAYRIDTEAASAWFAEHRQVMALTPGTSTTGVGAQSAPMPTRSGVATISPGAARPSPGCTRRQTPPASSVRTR
jgi:hypothetical protein